MSDKNYRKITNAAGADIFRGFFLNWITPREISIKLDYVVRGHVPNNHPVIQENKKKGYTDNKYVTTDMFPSVATSVRNYTRSFLECGYLDEYPGQLGVKKYSRRYRGNLNPLYDWIKFREEISYNFSDKQKLVLELIAELAIIRVNAVSRKRNQEILIRKTNDTLRARKRSHKTDRVLIGMSESLTKAIHDITFLSREIKTRKVSKKIKSEIESYMEMPRNSDQIKLRESIIESIKNNLGKDQRNNLCVYQHLKKCLANIKITADLIVNIDDSGALSNPDYS